LWTCLVEPLIGKASGVGAKFGIHTSIAQGFKYLLRHAQLIFLVLLQSDQKKDGDEQGHGHPEHKDDNRNQSAHWCPADDVGALTNHGESHRCELRRTRRLAQS